MGDTGITYEEFAYLLNSLFLLPPTNEALNAYIDALKAQAADPSETNEKKTILALYNYGLSIQENANPPVYRDGTGELKYSQVTLVTPQPFTLNFATYNCPSPRSPYAIFPVPTPPPYPPGIPPNPYCALTLVNVQLYGILQTPAYWPYIWLRLNPDTGFDQRLLYNSTYLANQTAVPESVMAISSILIDTANTRYFARPGFGFSSRIYADGKPSYNVCLMKFLKDRQDTRLFQNLQDIFFVRLSLVRI